VSDMLLKAKICSNSMFICLVLWMGGGKHLVLPTLLPTAVFLFNLLVSFDVYHVWLQCTNI